MSRLDSLITTARQIAALGVTKATLSRETSEQEGTHNVPAMVTIDTSLARSRNSGGGTVGWSFYVNCESGREEGLNALLRHVCDIVNDATYVAATVRNAYENRRLAEERAVRSEAKLAKVLSGGRIRGQFLVRLTATSEVWLLDPAKKDAGFGLCFSSLGALWQAHPDLRPVRWADGDLIVEAWVYEAEADGAI